MSKVELKAIINLWVGIIGLSAVVTVYLFEFEMRKAALVLVIAYVFIIVFIAIVSFVDIYVENNIAKYVSTKLKPNNIVNNLRLETVEGTVKGLMIIAGYDINNKHYKYIAFYDGDGIGLPELVKKKGIGTIKTWIDFSVPNAFEFDINDFCEQLGIKIYFRLNTSEACSNLRRANALIKHIKENM